MNEAVLNPSPQQLWYYADGANQPVGPLPMDALQHLANAGVIQPETHVIEKGGTEWKPLHSIYTGARSALASPAANSAHAPAKENPPQQSSLRRLSQTAKDSQPPEAFAKQHEQKQIEFASESGKQTPPSDSERAISGCFSIIIGGAILWGVFSLIRGSSTTADNEKSRATESRTEVKPVCGKSPAKFIVFAGQSRTEVYGGVPVTELTDMLEAIYTGKISIEQASECVFNGDSLGDLFTHNVTGKYIIYHARTDTGEFWDVALPRKAKFEEENRHGKSVADYYQSLIEHGFANIDTDNPVNEKNGVRIVGFEQFVTEGGLLKRVPVIETVAYPAGASVITNLK